MRSDDLCPGTTANEVPAAWVQRVPGRGTWSTGELSVGVQSPCIAMAAAQPSRVHPQSGTALTCPSEAALAVWAVSATLWTGVLECPVMPCVTIAALMLDDDAETAGAPLRTCMPMRPPMMASTTASNPPQRTKDPAVGALRGKRIVGSFLCIGPVA